MAKWDMSQFFSRLNPINFQRTTQVIDSNESAVPFVHPINMCDSEFQMCKCQLDVHIHFLGDSHGRDR